MQSQNSLSVKAGLNISPAINEFAIFPSRAAEVEEILLCSLILEPRVTSNVVTILSPEVLNQLTWQFIRPFWDCMMRLT
jgi:hypothetical protein